MSVRAGCGVLVVGLVSACASTSPKPIVSNVQQLVRARSDQTPEWLGDEKAEQQAREDVHSLTKGELTLTSALRVSLLANRKLQASFEELGVAQADVVQSGLLKNPTLSGAYGVPLDDGFTPRIELSLGVELLQLFTLGTRKDLARAGLEGAKYRVVEATLRHLYEVKVAYFASQAAQQTFEMRTAMNELAAAGVELAARQNAAGALSDLDLSVEQAANAQWNIDLARTRSDLATTRERLNRAMGVWGDDAAWRIGAAMRAMPTAELSLEHAESRAVASSPSLVAARKDAEIVSYGLALVKNTRWLGGVDAGVTFEKAPEHVRLIGPSLSVELPIFDQRQAAVARLEAQLRQAKHRELALAIDVRSEVRDLVARLQVARVIVENYQRTLVPLRQRVVALSQQQYNAMLLGVYQLLQIRQQEIGAMAEYIDNLREYWTARSDLERVVGGRLPAATPNHKP